MSIHARFGLAEPDEVEATLSVTMTIDRWKSFLLKLDESRYPAGVVGSAIRKMIREAEQAFHTTGEYDE